jgi:DNA-binding NtrC family response regulator
MHIPDVLSGNSSVMRTLREEVALAALCAAPVLITGERGVGKTTLARHLHQCGRPFRGDVRIVDSATVSAAQFEAELSRPGTLFLAHVGRLDRGLQDRAMRSLDGRGTREVRLLSGADEGLYRLVQQRQFREDLFYRLNILHLHVPPLRTRREDIPLLMARALGDAARVRGCAAPELTTEAQGAVTAYGWPGNLRELRSVADALMESRGGQAIGVEDLPPLLHVTRREPAPVRVTAASGCRVDIVPFERCGDV